MDFRGWVSRELSLRTFPILRLSGTVISNDAGKFVYEGLYYQILKHLQQSHSASQCVFVHVPVLNTANLPLIVKDFRLIIRQLAG